MEEDKFWTEWKRKKKRGCLEIAFLFILMLFCIKCGSDSLRELACNKNQHTIRK